MAPHIHVRTAILAWILYSTIRGIKYSTNIVIIYQYNYYKLKLNQNGDPTVTSFLRHLIAVIAI